MDPPPAIMLPYVGETASLTAKKIPWCVRLHAGSFETGETGSETAPVLPTPIEGVPYKF